MRTIATAEQQLDAFVLKGRGDFLAPTRTRLQFEDIRKDAIPFAL
jgi:hypothetical protein